MEHVINPFSGSDMVKLGMSSEEIQSIMGVEPERILKSQFDTELSDFYDEMIVYYDDSKTSYMIDFTEPGVVLFNGISIIGKPIAEVETMFRRLDDDIRYDIINGFVSLKYDIAVYSETMNSPVESVAVAKQGVFRCLLDKT